MFRPHLIKNNIYYILSKRKDKLFAFYLLYHFIEYLRINIITVQNIEKYYVVFLEHLSTSKYSLYSQVI